MSFYGITDYITYLLGVVAIVLLPGPNSMYCLFIASSQGVKDGYKAVSAIITGDFILMTSAVFGATTLLKTSATIFTIFKVLGGIYLFYIGINLLIDVYKAIKNAKQDKLTSIEKTLNKKKNKKNKQGIFKIFNLEFIQSKSDFVLFVFLFAIC